MNYPLALWTDRSSLLVCYCVVLGTAPSGLEKKYTVRKSIQRKKWVYDCITGREGERQLHPAPLAFKSIRRACRPVRKGTLEDEKEKRGGDAVTLVSLAIL